MEMLTEAENQEIKEIEKFHNLFNAFYKEKKKELKKRPMDNTLLLLNNNRLNCLVISLEFCRFLIKKNHINNFLFELTNKNEKKGEKS